MTMKTKQRMLTEDWELFKQRRFIEEQVRLWVKVQFKEMEVVQCRVCL